MDTALQASTRRILVLPMEKGEARGLAERLEGVHLTEKARIFHDPATNSLILYGTA